MGQLNEDGKFEIQLIVTAADIDELNHVSNIVYVRWVQEVAVAHWQALASEQAQRKVVWVVLRHEIDYKAPAVLGDDVIVRTWVGRVTGITFERHTEIVRLNHDRLLASARTVWCPISAETGRPTRVGAEIRQQFSSRLS